MTSQHPEDYPLSTELRTTLCQLLALGFMDRTAHRMVEDDDLISTDDANVIYGLAETMVDRASEHLAEDYRESPESVYQALYTAGIEAADAVEAKAIQRN